MGLGLGECVVACWERGGMGWGAGMQLGGWGGEGRMKEGGGEGLLFVEGWERGGGRMLGSVSGVSRVREDSVEWRGEVGDEGRLGVGVEQVERQRRTKELPFDSC